MKKEYVKKVKTKVLKPKKEDNVPLKGYSKKKKNEIDADKIDFDTA